MIVNFSSISIVKIHFEFSDYKSQKLFIIIYIPTYFKIIFLLNVIKFKI